ncbi:hypothetical protein ACWDBO_53215 [Streptomyces mirabilis]|nr:hypothetical protein [Streptomyces sp. AK02-04a]MDX3763810.1 hypothetical protein [Streptomyces sp. AK02-04a]
MTAVMVEITQTRIHAKDEDPKEGGAVLVETLMTWTLPGCNDDNPYN